MKPYIFKDKSKSFGRDLAVSSLMNDRLVVKIECLQKMSELAQKLLRSINSGEPCELVFDGKMEEE